LGRRCRHRPSRIGADPERRGGCRYLGGRALGMDRSGTHDASPAPKRLQQIASQLRTSGNTYGLLRCHLVTSRDCRVVPAQARGQTCRASLPCEKQPTQEDAWKNCPVTPGRFFQRANSFGYLLSSSKTGRCAGPKNLPSRTQKRPRPPRRPARRGRAAQSSPAK